MASRLEEPEGPSSHRPTTSYSNLPELSAPFHIDSVQRSYKHQYSNIYFVRLVELRPVVEKNAQERWGSVRGELGRGVFRLENDIDRQASITAKNLEPPKGSTMLHRWDSLSGDAAQAECTRGYGPRCELLSLPTCTSL